MIEPNLIMGHSDYHPAVNRALGAGVELPVDPPSSILGGEAFLARIYTAMVLSFSFSVRITKPTVSKCTTRGSSETATVAESAGGVKKATSFSHGMTVRRNLAGGALVPFRLVRRPDLMLAVSPRSCRNHEA